MLCYNVFSCPLGRNGRVSLSTLATLTDISVVILAIEAFVILLVPGVIVFFAIRGINWLQRQLRKYGPMARFRFNQAAQISEDMSHYAAAPFIAASATSARLRRIQSVVSSSVSGMFTKEV